jgi:hypothetical protein
MVISSATLPFVRRLLVYFPRLKITFDRNWNPPEPNYLPEAPYRAVHETSAFIWEEEKQEKETLP